PCVRKDVWVQVPPGALQTLVLPFDHAGSGDVHDDRCPGASPTAAVAEPVHFATRISRLGQAKTLLRFSNISATLRSGEFARLAMDTRPN
ncbi:MAG: hypothetical protein ACKVIQ_10840, partial [Acidimicrobiales bacterium]